MTTLDAPDPLADRIYKPSGRVSPVRSTVAAVLGLLIGLVIGGVYAVLVYYIPIIYANILALLAAAFVLGSAVIVMLRASRVRSTFMALLIALGAGAATLYGSWVVWLPLVVGESTGLMNELGFAGRLDMAGFLFPRPQVVWDYARWINEFGTWSIGRSSTESVSGVALWGVWAVEAAVLLLGPAYWVWASFAGTPYCEDCGSWTEPTQGVASFADEQPETLRADAIAGRIDALAARGPATFTGTEEHSAPPPRVRADTAVCPGCGELRCLSLTRVTSTISKGELQEKEKPVVRNVMLTEPELAWLREVGEQQFAERNAPVTTDDAPAPDEPQA